MSSVTRRCFVVVLSILVGLVVLAAVVQPAAAQSTTADVVYGQGGTFTTNTANEGGISARPAELHHFGLSPNREGNSRVARLPSGTSH